MTNPLFVQIKTEDGLTLPGLLYGPQDLKKVVINLHGNGSASVFYKHDENRIMAEALEKAGIALLRFNNRGAHFIKKLNVEKPNGEVERKRYGMSYEIIKECVQDIDAAVSFLEQKGFSEFYLLGHSTGANKICVYNFYKPENKIAKYILASGGDDTGIYYDELGKEKFYRLLNKAKGKIEKGEGEEIISELLPEEIFSYISFYDIANPDGDYNTFPFMEVLKHVKLSTKPLFRYFDSIQKPTLVLYGEKDEYAWNPPQALEILKERKPEFTYELIKDADHGFTGHEQELAETITKWLTQ